MRKTSYESILRAVGRVLDLAEADRFAVRNTADGLLLEAFDGHAKPKVVVNLGIPEVAQLVDWADESQDAHPDYTRAGASDEGTLRHLLASHQRELVGAL